MTAGPVTLKVRLLRELDGALERSGGNATGSVCSNTPAGRQHTWRLYGEGPAARALGRSAAVICQAEEQSCPTPPSSPARPVPRRGGRWLPAQPWALALEDDQRPLGVRTPIQASRTC